MRWEIPANVTATADRALLTEALRQLLANAWKFTSARDVAQISFRASAARPGTSRRARLPGGRQRRGFRLAVRRASLRGVPADALAGGISLRAAASASPSCSGSSAGMEAACGRMRRPRKGRRFSFTLESAAASRPASMPARRNRLRRCWPDMARRVLLFQRPPPYERHRRTPSCRRDRARRSCSWRIIRTTKHSRCGRSRATACATGSTWRTTASKRSTTSSAGGVRRARPARTTQRDSARPQAAAPRRPAKCSAPCAPMRARAACRWSS